VRDVGEDGEFEGILTSRRGIGRGRSIASLSRREVEGDAESIDGRCESLTDCPFVLARREGDGRERRRSSDGASTDMRATRYQSICGNSLRFVAPSKFASSCTDRSLTIHFRCRTEVTSRRGRRGGSVAG